MKYKSTRLTLEQRKAKIQAKIDAFQSGRGAAEEAGDDEDDDDD